MSGSGGGDPASRGTTLAREIASRSQGARTVPELYQEALALVCERLEWPVGRVALVRPRESEMEDREHDPRPLVTPTEIRHGDASDPGGGEDPFRDLLADDSPLSRRIVEQGLPVWMERIDDHPELVPPGLPPPGFSGGILATPVMDPSGMRAILYFFDPDPRSRVEVEAQEVECLGVQLGWMAEVLERDLESKRTRLQLERVVTAIREIGAAGMDPDEVMRVSAEQAQELTGATSAGVSVQAESDPDTIVLKGASGNAVPYLGDRSSISETLSGHAFEMGEVLISNDTARDPRVNQEVVEETGLRALIAVPLRADGDRVVGLLNVMSNRPHVFDEGDVQLLHVLSEQMGSALDRARAFHANERLLEDLSETAEALEETLEEREAILDASLLGIIAMDPQLRVTLWSRAAQELYGWSKEEVLGKPLPILPEFRREEAVEHIQRVLGGVSVRHLDVTHVRKDGSPVEVRLSAAPIRSAVGKSGVVAVIMDMTEIRKVEARLRQAERMESIGRLAGGVAHDFNNMLTAIRGHADLLRTGQLSEEDEDSVHHIVEAVERAESVTRQLLAYSRRQHQQARPVHPAHAIREMTGLLQRLLEERVVLDFELDDEAGPVLADPAQLDQIVMNLVLNARDAMPDGGEVRITCSRVPAGDVALADLDEDAETDFVEISVADEGQGVPPEIRDRIFEPFFSTKAPGQGTGLGLATVYGLVHQSGGTIRLESEVGVGSTFYVHLPVVDPDAPQAPEPRAKAPESAVDVLLVENVSMVERLIRRILEPRGYRVRSVNESRRALDLLRSEKPGPDVLITDASRGPGKPGVFLENIRHVRPDLPVLVLSDGIGTSEPSSDTPGSPDLPSDPGTARLLKPFSPDTLVRKVADLLEES